MNNEQWIISNERTVRDKHIAQIAWLALQPLLLTAKLAHDVAGEGSFSYNQSRIGHNNIPFTIHKIRTLYPNTILRTSLGASDPSATTIGNVFRALNIDEIPQLQNIIDGDMRIIGPRPLLELDVDAMRSELPRSRYDEWEEAYFKSIPGGISSFALLTRNETFTQEQSFYLRAENDIHDFQAMSQSYEKKLISNVIRTAMKKRIHKK